MSTQTNGHLQVYLSNIFVVFYQKIHQKLLGWLIDIVTY